MFESVHIFKEAFLSKLEIMHGKSLEEAAIGDIYAAVASMVRDEASRKWVQTNSTYLHFKNRQVYYFSLEFLLGKLLGLYLQYMGIEGVVSRGLRSLGVDYKAMLDAEPEAGLGNGGLGRLAACFLDSMASLGIPGHGCGIRYKYGLFEQKIVDGYQVELPDNWLKEDNIWEIRKPDKAVEVRFGGDVSVHEADGRLIFNHNNYDRVLAVPYDIPITGYGNDIVNTLRLWSAEAVHKEFDFASFSRGDYMKAVEYKYSVEAISEVLYPDDSNYTNRVLRLKQQYFLVSAGVQSIVRRYGKTSGDIRDLHKKMAIHINDTHPALAVPELMRILIDEKGLGWDEAWHITENTISYTNHTIMTEALEKWPIEIFQSLLPRIFMIVNEINERFCKTLWGIYPGDWDRIRHMAIVADGQVKMANLAIAGSYSVNGVAAVHTGLLKKEVMRDFYECFPDKFNNKTNGIAHRRWLIKANPGLTSLINEAIGKDWIKDAKKLESLVLEGHHNDPCFRSRLASVKKHNKSRLARYIKSKYGISIDTKSIFDSQVKRIHAYKRQLLNILRIMDLYNRLKENPNLDIQPRTFIISGKAAPSYYYAKLVIKLINTLSSIINNDKSVNSIIKLIFLENYSVSLAELIFPASDISEQISTASKEASGTGNMKFMMNGAITVGTMDGANIEIFNSVGEENIITFGLSVGEVLEYYQNGGYYSYDEYNGNARLKKVLDQLIDGSFPLSKKEELSGIYNSLLKYNDEFFVLKDFNSYLAAQDKVDKLYRQQEEWQKMAAVNIAKSGAFSSDGTIRQYAEEIWKTRQIGL